VELDVLRLDVDGRSHVRAHPDLLQGPHRLGAPRPEVGEHVLDRPLLGVADPLQALAVEPVDQLVELRAAGVLLADQLLGDAHPRTWPSPVTTNL
jgi:hypothetical protein